MNIALGILNSVTFNDTYISGVTKTSIMGNVFDVTWDFYMGYELFNELDLDFTVSYYIKGEFFYISGPTYYFDEAIIYIEKTKETQRGVTRAYDYATKHDITESIIEISGPKGDFYSNTPFEVQCLKDTVIVDTNLELHKFLKGDFFILEK